MSTEKYMLILTDWWRNRQLPGEVLALTQYIADIPITKSAKRLRPPSDNWILPTGRLHVTPHIIAGLHAGTDDLNGRKVPIGPCTDEDLERPSQYKATYRTPTLADRDIEHINEVTLGPPT